jgi:hypothetical protein
MADFEGYCDMGPGYRYSLNTDEKKYTPEDAQENLTEEDLMICQNRVAGYSFRENTWGKFDIDAISEITYDSEAFDYLILPAGQKQQLLSLVGVHEDDGFSFDDLIKGKGKGMTFLLYGEPGLGKTLTAGMVYSPSESQTNKWFRKCCGLLPKASSSNRCWNTWNISAFSGERT